MVNVDEPANEHFIKDYQLYSKSIVIVKMQDGKELKWENLDEKSGKEPIRTILKIAELFDVSPVTYPAYPDTKVAVRSLEAAKEHMDDPPFVPLNIPELLRDYADKWEKIPDADEGAINVPLVELSSQIMTELKERFLNAEPTQGDKGDPTKAQNNSEPTQAELDEARERSKNLLDKIKKRGI